jgi:low temperature requirement A protein (LtrA)
MRVALLELVPRRGFRRGRQRLEVFLGGRCGLGFSRRGLPVVDVLRRGRGSGRSAGPVERCPLLYTHVPMWAALISVAAGMNLLIEEAGLAELDVGARWAICGGAAVYLCCASLIQDATARGLLWTILGVRLSVVGLLVVLAFIGASLRPVTFAALMLAVLVALVAFEISRNLRPDAHPPLKTSAQ